MSTRPDPARRPDLTAEEALAEIEVLADEWASESGRYAEYAVGSSVPDVHRAVSRTLSQITADLRAVLARVGQPQPDGEAERLRAEVRALRVESEILQDRDAANTKRMDAALSENRELRAALAEAEAQRALVSAPARSEPRPEWQRYVVPVAKAMYQITMGSEYADLHPWETSDREPFVSWARAALASVGDGTPAEPRRPDWADDAINVLCDCTYMDSVPHVQPACPVHDKEPSGDWNDEAASPRDADREPASEAGECEHGVSVPWPCPVCMKARRDTHRAGRAGGEE